MIPKDRGEGGTVLTGYYIRSKQARIAAELRSAGRARAPVPTRPTGFAENRELKAESRFLQFIFLHQVPERTVGDTQHIGLSEKV